jgi:hypothetical protein
MMTKNMGSRFHGNDTGKMMAKNVDSCGNLPLNALMGVGMMPYLAVIARKDKVLTKQSMLLKERLPRLLRNPRCLRQCAMIDRTKRKDCHSPSGFAMTTKTKKSRVIPECLLSGIHVLKSLKVSLNIQVKK